jgi:hypothetical protein
MTPLANLDIKNLSFFVHKFGALVYETNSDFVWDQLVYNQLL